ncbi:MAG: preprotein translocase subunit SecE [Candidatus Dadabacteria bacterium]|nr:preprotein translocase subunit SecE [Candidatus Dadabacteria bacterium]NIX15161.1 preprotein translocase subunit SecE [Candidatus Dadabacteria bacterium]NIY21806.1 preprotein translocase subunit SecE [Candidatus Dadabacteria bacterium]
MSNISDLKNRTSDFLKDVEIEMTKITWPFMNDTLKSTMAVVVISAILVAFLFGVDSLFSMIVKYVLA